MSPESLTEINHCTREAKLPALCNCPLAGDSRRNAPKTPCSSPKMAFKQTLKLVGEKNDLPPPPPSGTVSRPHQGKRGGGCHFGFCSCRLTAVSCCANGAGGTSDPAGEATFRSKTGLILIHVVGQTCGRGRE